MEDLKNISTPSHSPVHKPIVLEGEITHIDQALAILRENDPEYVQDAVQYVMNHPAEATPLLLEILQEALVNPQKFIPPACDGDHVVEGVCPTETWGEKNSPWIHLYAAVLLGELKEKKAHSLLLQHFSLEPEALDDLFGDLVIEEVDYLLYATYDGSPEGIQALAANPKADLSSRVGAVDALSFLVADQKLDRLETLNFLTSLFPETPPEPGADSEFLDFVADTLLNLYPIEKMDFIESAFQRGLISDDFVTWEDFQGIIETSSVEECLDEIKEAILQKNDLSPEERINQVFEDGSMHEGDHGSDDESNDEESDDAAWDGEESNDELSPYDSEPADTHKN